MILFFWPVFLHIKLAPLRLSWHIMFLDML